MVINRVILLLFCLLLPTLTLASQPTAYLSGVVVNVYDGDTITVSSNNKITKVRLYGIDAPENASPGKWPAQPYSEKAKAFIAGIILNKFVTIRLKNERSYNRELGEVFYNGYSINREVVRAGLAWWNSKYEPYDMDLKNLQDLAKTQKKGLWHEGDPVTPWDWRKQAH